MASVSDLIERIRSHGANLTIDGGKLRVINGTKLPAGALDYIKKHGSDIAAFLDHEGDKEERAAIIEFDGGLTRAAAEYLTNLLIASPPAGADKADWSWFVSQAAMVIEGAPLRRAA